MADLQDSFILLCGLQQAASFGRIVRNGFFDQYIDPQLHQPATDIGMGDGGRRDDGRIGAGGNLFQTRKNPAAEARRHALVGVENARELRMFGLLQYADVVTAENSGSHDPDSGFCH